MTFPNDLPTDIDVIADDVVSELDLQDDDTLSNLGVILGQLDPVEVENGAPRWTNSQREIIAKMNGKFSEWKE